MSRRQWQRVARCALLGGLLALSPALRAQEAIELPGRDRPLEADFDELFRVGVFDGEPWEMFGEVSQVAFDGEGNLYVFDGTPSLLGSGNLRILVFDAAGRFLRRFGSWGGGPGEFIRPAAFAVLRDGTTVASDLGHRGYHIFDDAGAFVRMVRAGDGPGGIVAATDMVPDPRGGAVFAGNFDGRMSMEMTVSRSGPAAGPGVRPVRRVGFEGQVARVDTVVGGWMPSRSHLNDMAPGSSPEIRDMLNRMSLPAVFEPPLLVGVLPDGAVVHSDSSAYALKITPPGATEVARILRRPFEPEPVTPEVAREYGERSAAARERSMLLVRGPDRGGNAAPRLSGAFELRERFYREIPVIRALATSWDGRIWVQRRGEEPGSDGPIDILTAAGEYLGTYASGAIPMPDAFGPDGVAAFIELGELDVARVVVRRVGTEYPRDP